MAGGIKSILKTVKHLRWCFLRKTKKSFKVKKLCLRSLTGSDTPLVQPALSRYARFERNGSLEAAICKCSSKQLLLKISGISQENTCVGVSLLIKLLA